MSLKLAPYSLPLVPDYKSGAFRRATRLSKAVLGIVTSQDKRSSMRLQDAWTYGRPPRGGGGRKKQWMPKLYICLGASFYWPTILRLIKALKNSKFAWKFYTAPSGYERPDKIVVYFDTGDHLKRFVKTLRPLLPKSGFHKLRHAGSTAEMGLEPRDRRGLYVGMDPPFLGESWRMYRCVCMAWADLNEEYLAKLKGGRSRWLRRMNLSAEHEGPHTLAPDLRDAVYIRRYWRMIDNPR